MLLIRYCRQHGMMAFADMCWLSTLLRGQRFLVRCKSPGQPSGWAFVLGNICGSVGAVWLADEIRIGKTLCYVMRGRVAANDTLRFVLKLSEWEAMEFQWRSLFRHSLHGEIAQSERWASRRH